MAAARLVVGSLLVLACGGDPDEVQTGLAGAGSGGEGTIGGGGGGSSADGGEATTAGAGGAGGGEAPGGVPVVFAQGHVGRTMFSCDDGETWGHDRSDDAGVVCGDGFDCDHHVGSATGMVVAGGAAVMSSGWGTPGRVRRSVDGVTWDLAFDVEFPFASLAVGDGVLMGATPRPWTSSDGGATWLEVPRTYLAPPLRASLHIPYGEGRFVLTSDQADAMHVWLTDDAGTTFFESSAVPDACLAPSLSYGNDVLLMPTLTDAVCRSIDGGETWSSVSTSGTFGYGTLQFVGRRFVAIGDAGGAQPVLYESADGSTWTSTPTNLPVGAWSVVLGHDEETSTLFAAAGAYDGQRMFRSEDGLDWDEVTGAPTGHPIRRFVSGRLDAPACP